MNRTVLLSVGAAAACVLAAAAVILLGTRTHDTTITAPPIQTTVPAAASTSAPQVIPPAATAISAAAQPDPLPTSADTDEPRINIAVLAPAGQRDAQAVAAAAIAALYSVDTSIDGAPSDAAHRAAYLLAPALAARLTTPSSTGSGLQWRQWTDQHAYTTVTTKTIAIPWTVADSRSTVVRNVGFIQTVHTAAGATSLPQQTLALTLTRSAADQPWRVESMETP